MTSSPAIPSTRRRWMLRLMALVLGLTFALGMAEILTRIFLPHPRYPELTVPNERVGMLYRPGARGRATNMFGEFDSAIAINHEGFRDTDHPLVKPPHTFRIAFIGDSFTFAEQVEEPQAFVRRTETLLNEKLRAGGLGAFHVECLNFGVGGWDTYQEALCYEYYVRKYHPDLMVLAMYLHNDFSGNAFYLIEQSFGRPYFRLKGDHLEKVPADMAQMERNARASERHFGVRWYHHLQFYNAQRQLQWEIRQWYRRRTAPPSTDPWKDPLDNNYRYSVRDDGDPWRAVADRVSQLLLERIESMTREDGARFRAAMLPAEENLHPEKWPERVKLLPALKGIPMDFDRPFRMVRQFLPGPAARGDLLDLRPALRQAAEGGTIFFHRDNHYNRRGQETVARAMAEWIAPLAIDAARKDGVSAATP